jgi:hypothetical protein
VAWCGCAPGAASGPTGGLDPGFEQRLDLVQGCGDTVLTATDLSGDVSLRFTADGVARQAHEVGEVLAFTYRFATDEALEVHLGSGLADDPCAPADPDEVYRAVGGLADLTVAQRDGTAEWPAYYELVVAQASLENASGATLELYDFTLELTRRN